MTLPVPNLKPSVQPPVAGTERCGCCDGITIETPQATDNRGGLSAIGYRIGDYAQFRESLHALLSSSAFPQLAALRSRSDDDFTIGLLDAFACSADVLTFYQERIANESYVRTALERVSLQEMGKLIGYRLRPGVAAETWLAFAVETPPTPPPDLVPEPGNFVTGVPQLVQLDAGLQVQSVPGQGEKPQTFETLEGLAAARPEWNAVRPWFDTVERPGSGATFTYLAGVKTNLKAGDALLFVGDEFLADENSNNWDFRLIDGVEPDVKADRTLVRWIRPLGSLAPFADPALQDIQVHALRKRAAVFGHNAPMWASMPLDYRNNYPAPLAPVFSKGWWPIHIHIGPGEWPGFVISPAGDGYVDTDAVYSEVRSGSFVVLAKGAFDTPAEPAPAGAYVELYRVSSASEVSRAEFALSGKVSRLQLQGANYATFRSEVRGTTVFLQSEPLEFAPYPECAPVEEDSIPAAVGASGLSAGRKLIVKGEALDGTRLVVEATLVSAQEQGPGRSILTIAPPLPVPLRRDTVVVYANVVLASHGETVSQVLGNGDASQPFQTFELKQVPLTYRAAPNETGARAELTIRVADVAWKERSTMYGAAPQERAYVLSLDEQGRQLVRFGDGLAGARLPSGINNVRALYRKGLGLAGNVAAEKLTQLMSRPLGLKSVTNPIAAQGGTDREEEADARQTMPLYTRTLGRAVSLLDFEDYARAFSGIAKAQVSVLHLGSETVAAVTIAGPAGSPVTASSPVWTNLATAFRENGDPFVPVRLVTHRASTFHLGLRVQCDSDRDSSQVLAAVEAALRSAFAFDRRELGQAVQQSEVIAVAQAVPGVTAIDLVRLYGGTEPPAQAQVSLQSRLLASRMQVEQGAIQPAELLTLDPGPLDLLEPM
jgi:hypothetical protein